MYAWGDNDHGQQGNGSTIVNRKPALVQGLEDVLINRVACGSSHSIAWTIPDMPVLSKQEPVIFPLQKDPLGSSLLGLYDDEKPLKSHSKDAMTLSSIVMSLDSSTSKQQALQHILNAMYIHQLRQSIVKSLRSHTNMGNTSLATTSKVKGFDVHARSAIRFSFRLLIRLIFHLITRVTRTTLQPRIGCERNLTWLQEKL